MENIEDLYTDYLLSSFGQVTSTGLSSVLDGSVSHDKITHHLSGGAFGGRELWLSAKSFAKKHRSDDACIIFDDYLGHSQFSSFRSFYKYYSGRQKNMIKGYSRRYLLK